MYCDDDITAANNTAAESEINAHIMICNYYAYDATDSNWAELFTVSKSSISLIAAHSVGYSANC